MLNKIWPVMIIVSVIFGFLNGRMEAINEAVFISLEDTVDMSISFLGIMCFWSGMIKILTCTKILDKAKNFLKGFINRFFGQESEKAKELITLNMVSNILGIANAATPVGIKAMHELDKSNNNDKLSYEMSMFVLLNTLSIQLIPTTIISIRASMGSTNAGKIIIPVWIVTVITFVITMLIGSRMFKKEKNDECI